MTIGNVTQAGSAPPPLDYEQFLRAKVAIDAGRGWAVEPHAIHPVLKPHNLP